MGSEGCAVLLDCRTFETTACLVGHNGPDSVQRGLMLTPTHTDTTVRTLVYYLGRYGQPGEAVVSKVLQSTRTAQSFKPHYQMAQTFWPNQPSKMSFWASNYGRLTPLAQRAWEVHSDIRLRKATATYSTSSAVIQHDVVCMVLRICTQELACTCTVIFY